MDIARALAISAQTAKAKADQFCVLAVDIAARRPDPAPSAENSMHEPELVDDSANATVLDVARARVNGVLRLLRPII